MGMTISDSILMMKKRVQITLKEVSLSFGASRVMQFRKKKGKHPIEAEIILNHGDMLVMYPGCQDEYKHAIPKRKKVKNPRINLTFRLFQ